MSISRARFKKKWDLVTRMGDKIGGGKRVYPKLLDYPLAKENECYWNVVNYAYEHKLYRTDDWYLTGGYYGDTADCNRVFPRHNEHFWLKNITTNEHFEITLKGSVANYYYENKDVILLWEDGYTINQSPFG